VDGEGVATFKSIPFAAPPVGPLRFKRSVPAEAWAGVLPCLEFGAVSPQATPEPGQVCDEDCLTLTVYNAVGA
jgi:para-nitrobenzyl esterase